MRIDFTHRDIRTPFALLRALIPHLDSATDRAWQSSPLTRPIFHRYGVEGESLSERQTPEDQLRYYTTTRVLRGIRHIAVDYGDALPAPLTITLPSFPASPDALFLGWLGEAANVSITIAPSTSRELETDPASELLAESVRRVARSEISLDELSLYISALLSFGDSWSAKVVADAYLSANNSVDPRIADVLGIPYALQGETGTARLIWEVWSTASVIDEARSLYSLSMLDARHHPRALLNQSSAAARLEKAFERLRSVPDSAQVTYERIFNRNGIALLLFRQKRLAEARQLLERGIYELSESEFAHNIHHTVLTSNLARVVQAMGDLTESERLFRAAIAMDPKFAEYHQDLASFLADEQRWDETLEEIETAIELDPSMPEAHRLAGFISMELGQPSVARDRFDSAVRLGDGSAVLDMLRASFAAGTPEWTRAARARVAFANLDDVSRAEADLIFTQAECELDPTRNVEQALNELRARHPGDELIERAWMTNVGV